MSFSTTTLLGGEEVLEKSKNKDGRQGPFFCRTIRPGYQQSLEFHMRWSQNSTVKFYLNQVIEAGAVAQ